VLTCILRHHEHVLPGGLKPGIRQQDEDLDELSESVARLGQVGRTIGEELDTQVGSSGQSMLSSRVD